MTTTAPAAPSASAPGADAPLDAATKTALDVTISSLAEAEKTWATTSLADRAALLDRVHASVVSASAEWASTASAIKGLDPQSQAVGEEWISGPYPVLTATATLARSIRALAAGSSPIARKRLGTAPDGRVTIPVLPGNAYEAILLHGFSAEVWMPPQVTADQVRAGAGLAELNPTKTNGVGLVLGAGNITSIPPLDVLYEIVAGLSLIHI